MSKPKKKKVYDGEPLSTLELWVCPKCDLAVSRGPGMPPPECLGCWLKGNTVVMDLKYKPEGATA